MMPRFLLDEHLAPAIADAVRSLKEDMVVIPLAGWQDGAYLGASDDTLLQAAFAAGFTLVTFDQRTIMPLLQTWAQEGRTHGGVVFVSAYTFATDNVGALSRALVRLWRDPGDIDWTNVTLYLQDE